MNNKCVAILLALFFGGIGIHKFFVGRVFQGLIYLLFAWTGIPYILAIIDAVRWLCMTDMEFEMKYS